MWSISHGQGHGGKHEGNLHRDLLRMIMRSCSMPEPYYGPIPIHDHKTNKTTVIDVPMILPHEVLAQMAIGRLADLVDTSSMPADNPITPSITAFCNRTTIDPRRVVAVGFHGDGVPHQANHTIQVFSWNIATKPDSDRVLFGCMPTLHFCACGCKGAHTNDAFLKIFAWSMQILASGQFPECRHDGTKWGNRQEKI